jgi:hypothetical protein
MHLMRRIELVVVIFELVAIGMQSTATTTTTTSTTSSLEMQKSMRRRRRRRRRSKFHSSSSSCSKSDNTTQIFARVLKEMEFGSGTKHPPAKKLRTQC